MDGNTESETLHVARRLEQSVSLAGAPGCETFAEGPFRIFFDPHAPERELNYAMPVALVRSAEELEPAILRLRSLFVARGRTLRFEFVAELWPELAAALEERGLEVTSCEPLMACTPATFAPVAAAGVAVHALTRDAAAFELAQFIHIRDETDTLPSAEQVARLRERIARGRGTFALATLDGEPAGTGCCFVGDDRLGELVAIVTRRDLRRRGVAGTVVSTLVGRYFTSGGALAWLTAASGGAGSMYARLGFREVGTLVSYEDTDAVAGGGGVS